MAEITTLEESVRALVHDGDTVATGGFVGIGFAEEIAIALEELYLANEGDAPYTQGKPRNLTLVSIVGAFVLFKRLDRYFADVI